MTTPYYQPYWIQSDEDKLEHYGVKGMKWGVRKDDDKLKSQTSKFSKQTLGYISKEDLESGYAMFEAYAQQHMEAMLQNLNNAASLSGNNSLNSLSASDRDKLWNQAYSEAIKDLGINAEGAALLMLYQALLDKGIAAYFDIEINEKNGKPYALFVHRETKKTFKTIDAAVAYMKSAGKKQRDKNVNGEAVSITVHKDKPVSGGPTGNVKDKDFNQMKVNSMKQKVIDVGTNAINSALKKTNKKKR